MLYILQGTLFQLTKERKDQVPKDMYSSLDKLYSSIKTSAERGYDMLAKENSKYLKSFKFIVNSSWFYERDKQYKQQTPIPLKQLLKYEKKQ